MLDVTVKVQPLIWRIIMVGNEGDKITPDDLKDLVEVSSRLPHFIVRNLPKEASNPHASVRSRFVVPSRYFALVINVFGDIMLFITSIMQIYVHPS